MIGEAEMRQDNKINKLGETGCLINEVFIKWWSGKMEQICIIVQCI